jgi:hypothetical protein
MSVEKALGTPEFKPPADHPSPRAWALAYVFQQGEVDSEVDPDQFDRDDVVTVTRDGRVFIEIRESYLWLVVKNLAQGKGRLVVFTFWNSRAWEFYRSPDTVSTCCEWCEIGGLIRTGQSTVQG